MKLVIILFFRIWLFFLMFICFAFDIDWVYSFSHRSFEQVAHWRILIYQWVIIVLKELRSWSFELCRSRFLYLLALRIQKLTNNLCSLRHSKVISLLFFRGGWWSPSENFILELFNKGLLSFCDLDNFMNRFFLWRSVHYAFFIIHWHFNDWIWIEKILCANVLLLSKKFE